MVGKDRTVLQYGLLERRNTTRLGHYPNQILNCILKFSPRIGLLVNLFGYPVLRLLQTVNP